MDKEISKSFQIQIEGDIKPINEVLSKARARIFYKYLNRNSTYITDEFADKLLKSIPYSPVMIKKKKTLLTTASNQTGQE